MVAQSLVGQKCMSNLFSPIRWSQAKADTCPLDIIIARPVFSREIEKKTKELESKAKDIPKEEDKR